MIDLKNEVKNQIEKKICHKIMECVTKLDISLNKLSEEDRAFAKETLKDLVFFTEVLRGYKS